MGRLRLTARKITKEGLQSRNANPFPTGTVLVSTTATIGNVAVAEEPTYCNQQITAIVGGEQLIPEYLGYYLLYARAALLRLGGTSTATHINQKSLATLLIPVRPQEEQRYVVDLLSRAEGIVRMRREAEAKAREIIPALFVEMFGDPGTNPKGGVGERGEGGEGRREADPIVRLGELVQRFEGGKNLQAGDAGDSEYRILKISAVTSGQYDESEAKPAPGGFTPPAHYVVRPGDLLFSRANTEELVGATALVDATDGRSLLPDKLWRFVWKDPDQISSVYMLALLQARRTRKELSKIASGTGGSMKNISQAKLAALPVSIAPLAKQRQFECHARSAKTIQKSTEKATAIAESSFQSLLAGVFGDGE